MSINSTTTNSYNINKLQYKFVWLMFNTCTNMAKNIG